MEGLDSFFNNVTTRKSNNDREFQNLMFVLVNEFHWSQQDIEDAELPFVFELMAARNRMIQEQERMSKKRRR